MASFLKAFLLVALVGLAGNAFADDARMADRVMGKEDAPVKVDEFVSLTCSHCAEFYAKTLPDLEKRYVDTGKVKFVFHDFPLDGPALKAAAVARCMPADEYFPFIKTLFSTQASWAFAQNSDPVANMIQYASLGGLPKDKAQACADDKDLQEAIADERVKAADKYQIEATPTFIINDGADIVRGAQNADTFAAVFDKLLAKK